MPTTLKRFAHAQVAPAATTVYTCPLSTSAIVLGREISNPSPIDLKMRLGLIPSGGTSDGTHYLLADQTVKAKTSLVIDTKLVLAAGDKLEAYSDPIPAPTGVSVATANSGGTLAAATYYYVVTGTNAAGETIAGTEVSVATSGTASVNTLNWTRSLGASGYKVYRSTTSGTEVLLATIGSNATTTYTDTGTATTSGTAPMTSTAGGCIFTISGAELS